MIRTTSLIAASLLAIGFQAAPAQAQLSRTFVSAASGNDANDCNRLTPCRTFQGAHDKTNSNGEITVLDPGGYGGLTITKSISIVNDGAGEASTLVSGGATGITVNAGPAGYVNLRGITIQGIGFGGGSGLRLNTAFSLTMTNCVVRNLTANGIELEPTTSSNFAASNTLVADNGGNGIAVFPIEKGASVKMSLTRVALHNNSAWGLLTFGSATTPIKVAVVDSVAAGNGQIGFGADGWTSLSLLRSVATGNSLGVLAQNSNSIVRVGQSTVTGNNQGWDAQLTGVLLSYGDNNIDGNTSGDLAPPTIAKK